MNIDKDIEIVKENIDDGTIYVRCGFTLNQAIENVLADRKMWKKIAEFLAENIDKWGMCFGGACIENCKQHIIDWARKEVEKDDN